MDFITSTLFDIFKNVISNRFDGYLFGEKLSQDMPAAATIFEKEEPSRPIEPKEQDRLFKSFDAVYDLSKILPLVEKPIVHLLFERDPSTHYRLPAYVLESSETGEWYVFSRGRLAFEGSGGGMHNAEEVMKVLRDKQTRITAWVMPNSRLDGLESGHTLWPTVKSECVPLLAVLNKDYEWSGILSKFYALRNKEEAPKELRAKDANE